MSKLIFVAGLPAAGKTTFSRALAGHLRIPSFHKDTIKEILCHNAPIETREQSCALSDTAFALIHHIADTSLRAGQPAILESNFRPTECAALCALLDQHSASAMDFVFTGDMTAIYARFTQREQSDERAAAHKAHGLHTLDQFSQAVLPLADFTTGSHTIRVDATSFDHLDFDALMRQAERFLQ